MGYVCVCALFCAVFGAPAFPETPADQTEALDLIRAGMSYRDAAQWAAAERALLAAYQKAHEVGPTGLDVSTSANELGHLYHDLGRVPDAERYYRIALRVAESNSEPDRVLAVLTNLASLYAETGQFAAVDRLHLAEQVQRHSESPAASAAMGNLAALAMTRGKFVEAEALYGEVLARQEARGAPREVAATLNNLSVLMTRTGRVLKAIALLERSLDLLERC